MTVHDIARHERVEMYLKAVLTLQEHAPAATITRVAEYMGVAPPSAYEMLRRLEGQRLVLGDGEGYRLTPEGRSRATRVVRRLRLAERLLADVLGLPLPKVYDEACKMEHVISDEVEERLADVLGHPTHCPHGWPIPGSEAAASEPALSLADLATGRRARVLTVPEEGGAAVARLWALGIRPEAEVEVHKVNPGGPVVRVGRQRSPVPGAVAARVFVRPL